jgi:hypothetical protein
MHYRLRKIRFSCHEAFCNDQTSDVEKKRVCLDGLTSLIVALFSASAGVLRTAD